MRAGVDGFDDEVQPSVGLPLDLVVYEANRFETDKVVCIDMHNPYYRMLHNSWGQKLREVFDSLEDPVWDDAHTEHAAEGAGTRAASRCARSPRPEEKLI